MANDKLYKGRYFIAFYDKTDEHFIELFDNVREILRWQGKPITRRAVNQVNVMLCRALQSEHHFTRLLTGEVMRVYIIDSTADE